MNTAKVYFEDGNTLTTQMNATPEQIEKYYLGKRFQFGDTEEHPKDKMVKAVKTTLLNSEFETAIHHYVGKKCLIEIHNSKTKESDFVRGEIAGIVTASDAEYRINVKTIDGVNINECHPDCITKYYYIGARNAWDIVPIGPFRTFLSAKKCLEITWDESIIKEA